jgi:hypothetical protein
LSMDAMTERRGSISTIHFILPDLKDDFRAHGSTLRFMPFHFKSRKQKRGQAVRLKAEDC